MRFKSTAFQAIVFSALLGQIVAPPSATAQTDAKPAADSAAKVHPLAGLLEIASQREKAIREGVRDYTCRIVKRERIDGEMQENRFIDTKVRLPQTANGQTKPLAVYMKFLGPKEIAGRTVVYVEGQNEGKMVVRRGGQRFGDVITNVDPDSDLARTESLMDIRHVGVAHMVSEIVKHLHEDMEADPTGENTELEVFKNAKINDRLCTHVRIKHLKRQTNLKFHEVNVYHRQRTALAGPSRRV